MSGEKLFRCQWLQEMLFWVSYILSERCQDHQVGKIVVVTKNNVVTSTSVVTWVATFSPYLHIFFHSCVHTVSLPQVLLLENVPKWDSFLNQQSDFIRVHMSHETFSLQFCQWLSDSCYKNEQHLPSFWLCPISGLFSLVSWLLFYSLWPSPLPHNCFFSCFWTYWALTQHCTATHYSTVQEAHSSTAVNVSSRYVSYFNICSNLCNTGSILIYKFCNSTVHKLRIYHACMHINITGAYIVHVQVSIHMYKCNLCLSS